MIASIPKVTLLHHKEAVWADFIKEYSILGELESRGMIVTEVKSLPQQNAHKSFAQLPEKLRRLLFFAKPDLVITLDDGRKPVAPIFAIDATEHVAARDHWIQRFPNLVGCAQESVPGAFVAPRDMPNRERFAGKTDPAFFFAYDRVMEIHQTPIYIAEWPSTDGANLDGDSKFGDLPPHDAPGIARMIKLLNLVVDAALKGADLAALTKDRLIVELRQELRSSAYQYIPQIDQFERLRINMPDNRPLSTSEFHSWVKEKGLSLPASLPDRMLKRSRHLVLTPMIKGSKEKRREALIRRIYEKGGDPYTQQPLVFDYLFCRLGVSPIERDTNLVVDLSVLHFSDFSSYVTSVWGESPLRKSDYSEIANDIPTYTLHLREGIAQVLKNFVRLHVWAADMIVFEDGIVYF